MKKITRIQLDKYIKEYATTKSTLEIGSYGNSDYKKYFPNRKGIDLRPGPGVDEIASAYDLPYADNSFDCILCISVLEHTEEPTKVISEMQRVLRPGGQVVLSVPFLFPMHDAPCDYWRFSRFAIEKLFKDWKILSIQHDTEPQIALAALLQRFIFQNKFYLNIFLKSFINLLILFLYYSPNFIKKSWGDGSRKFVTNDAFTLDYFVVCQKK